MLLLGFGQPTNAQEWVKTLPGQSWTVSVQKDLILAHEPMHDWWIIALRTDGQNSVGQQPPQSVQFQDLTFATDEDRFFAVTRLFKASNFLIEVIIDTNRQKDNEILEALPLNPWEARKLASETESGLCPTCRTENLFRPLQESLAKIRQDLTRQCQTGQTLQPEPRPMKLKMGCLKGLGLSLVQLVQFSSEIIKLIGGVAFEKTFRTQALGSTAALLWQVARAPDRFMAQLWEALKTSLQKEIKDFQKCGAGYQVQTICTLLTDLLVGGALTKQSKNYLTKTLSNKQVTKISIPESADVIQTRMAYQAVAAFSGGRIERTKSLFSNISEHFQGLTNNSQQITLRRSILALQKIENQKPKDLVEAAELSLKFKNEHFPIIQKHLEAAGVKSRLVEAPLPSDLELSEKLDALINERNSLRRHSSLDTNTIEKTTHAIADLQNRIVPKVKEYRSQGASRAITIKVDLSSHKMLKALKEKWNLQQFEIATDLDGALGDYSPGLSRIRILPSELLRGNGLKTPTLFHEIKHLQNYAREMRNQPGFVYGQFIRDRPETPGYERSFWLDELAAYGLTLIAETKPQFTTLKHTAESTQRSTIKWASKLKSFSDETIDMAQSFHSAHAAGAAVIKPNLGPNGPSGATLQWINTKDKKSIVLPMPGRQNLGIKDFNQAVLDELDRIEAIAKDHLDFAQKHLKP